uniref:ID755 n=1 Tax=Bradyrhizobium japonicum TaxID=375 RepID=Q9AMX8_BRAJP|nr:ID755 [Bradyrhizobium japonicum]
MELGATSRRAVCLTNAELAPAATFMAFATPDASRIKAKSNKINRISLIGAPKIAAAAAFFAATPAPMQQFTCRQSAVFWGRLFHSETRINPSQRVQSPIVLSSFNVGVANRPSRTCNAISFWGRQLRWQPYAMTLVAVQASAHRWSRPGRTRALS